MDTRYEELYHHGVKGMHWGVRRYQNADGSLTEAGQKKYGKLTKKLNKLEKKSNKKQKKADKAAYKFDNVFSNEKRQSRKLKKNSRKILKYSRKAIKLTNKAVKKGIISNNSPEVKLGKELLDNARNNVALSNTYRMLVN